jgi:hypothetical protein
LVQGSLGVPQVVAVARKEIEILTLQEKGILPTFKRVEATFSSFLCLVFFVCVSYSCIESKE